MGENSINPRRGVTQGMETKCCPLAQPTVLCQSRDLLMFDKTNQRK